MKKRAAGIVISIVIPVILSGGQLAPEVRDRALKVIATLEKLEQDQARTPQRPGGNCTITETDLNAWIAYQFSADMEKFVRSCELHLQSGNRAEGKLVIDLGNTPASAVLPARTDLFFSATAETKDGKIRLTMESLFLGTQRLSPAFIDTIIGIVAGLEGQPARSLHDWYPLPYAIQRLESQPGRLICYY
jgi:hypothetical protein